MKHIRANLLGMTGPAVDRRSPAQRRRWAVLVVAASAMGLVGCAGFERDWKRAVATRPVAERVEEGAWMGTWTSPGTNHSGPLRCVVGTETAGEAEFTYHARWSIFSGRFPTKQPVVRQGDGSVRSVGTWILPAWAGGRYDYDITIRDEVFSGTWKSRRDAGSFEMKRAEMDRAEAGPANQPLPEEVGR
jgi:hypothetical protein